MILLGTVRLRGTGSPTRAALNRTAEALTTRGGRTVECIVLARLGGGDCRVIDPAQDSPRTGLDNPLRKYMLATCFVRDTPLLPPFSPPHPQVFFSIRGSTLLPATSAKMLSVLGEFVTSRRSGNQHSCTSAALNPYHRGLQAMPFMPFNDALCRESASPCPGGTSQHQRKRHSYNRNLTPLTPATSCEGCRGAEASQPVSAPTDGLEPQLQLQQHRLSALVRDP